MLARIKKIGLILPVLFLCAIPASAQLGTIQGFCDNGGNHALTSGQPSSNYLQVDIPLCTVSVFYHDTTTLAPIFMGESSTGTLNSVQVTAGGSYSVCPTGVSFSGGGGSGATATVSCTAGAVVSVAVTSPGSGYTTAPTVSFTGGTGSGATAVATIVGDLTNPFQANTDGSWRVWAAIATGYDIAMSGGIPPNNYAQPRTITNIFPNAFGGTSYTIIQANGTASAPTSPVNFINSSTVNFSITGNQISAAVNAGSTLALEHNSSSTGILQSLYNLCDNGSCGPALDSGMQQVVAKTGTNDGSWVLETPATVSLTAFTSPPISGQHIIVYPVSVTTSGTCATANNTSGQVTWSQACNTEATDTWAFNVSSLTALGIPIGNVTAVYPFIVSGVTVQNTAGSGNTFLTNCSGTGVTLNNTRGDLGFHTSVTWPLTQFTSSTSLTVSTGNFNAMTCEIDASFVDGGVGQPRVIAGAATLVGAYVYYTGSPVTQPSQISVKAPLNYNSSNGTLSLPLPFDAVPDFGTANTYAVTSSSFTQAVSGLDVKFYALNASTSATPTLNVNGWGAWTIVGPTGAALSVGDITAYATSHAVTQVILGGNNEWFLENPQVSGGGAVSSVSNSDGSLTISPTTGAVVGSINYAHAGTWTALETFSAGIAIPSGQGVTQSTGGSTSNCWNTAGTTTACSGGGSGLTVGSTPISGGASGNGLYDNAGVLGEKAFAPALGNCTVETANFSAAAASCYVGNASSGITATLPSISTGAIIRIQNINAGTVTASFGSAFNCTLNGSTTSGTTCAIANGSTALATTDGTSWYVTVTPTGASSASLQLPVDAQTGTTYTLALGDASNGAGMVTMSNAAINTVTVPPHSSVAFPVGTWIQFVQLGAGQTSLAAGAGVTLDTPTSLSARAQFSTIGIVQIATDTWIVQGDTQ